MNLVRYLNEQDEYMSRDEARERIQEECSEILELYKREKMRFLRGNKRSMGDDQAVYVVPRTDRRPTDTDKDISLILDLAFDYVFGWRPRSRGVFATTEWNEARHYGHPYIFYPVNGYRYLWAPLVLDLYSHFGYANYKMPRTPEGREIIQAFKDYTNDYYDETDIMNNTTMRDVKWKKFLVTHDGIELLHNWIESNYQSRDLGSAFNKEVMFECKGYYLTWLEPHYL